MEHLGKSFIIVIDPPLFNIMHNKVVFDDFGFVISSQSQFFRDMMVKLCKKYHNIRMNHFSPKILTEIRQNINELRRKKIKTDVDTLKLVATFFDIAYYTAVSHDKDAHLRSFSTIVGTASHYFFYAGSKAYNSMVILEKIQKKIEISKNEENPGSYFELISIKN